MLLKVNHLNSGYDKRQIIFDISLEVNQGEIVLLVGGNGSGKSTLLKSIYGLTKKFGDFKNTVIFDNENISEASSHTLVKKGLVYVPQKNNVFDQLSVEENLQVVVNQLYGKSEQKKRMEYVYQLLPNLVNLKKRTPFHFSGGERQQLALGMALMHQPKLLLLDEPGAGLSPENWSYLIGLTQKLNQAGISFLIVEHKKEIEKITHRTLMMELGKFF